MYFHKLKCYSNFEYVLYDWNKDGYYHFRVRLQMFIEQSQYNFSTIINQCLLMKACINANYIYMYYNTFIQKNYSDWLRNNE